MSVSALLDKALRELDMHEAHVRGVPMRVFRNAPASLGEWYESAVRDHGGKVCLVEGDASLTYAECMEQASVFAGRIRAISGIGPGDRLAIAARNSVRWVISFLGTTWLGAIAVPMNAWWVSAELEYGLSDCGVTVAAVDKERLERLVPVLESLPDLRCLVMLEDLPSLAIMPRGNLQVCAWREVVPPGQQAVIEPHAPSADDAALILYTSGTTGFPKGVVLTQLNIMSNMASSKLRAIIQGIKPAGDAQLGTLINVPLFHATGLISALLQGLGMGRKQVVLQGRWDPSEACRLIERHRLTQFIGVPTQSMELVACEDFRQRDLRSLISIGGGGAAAPTRMVERIDSLGRSPWNGYGLTETTAGIINIAGADYAARPQSCGKAQVLMDVRIADAQGETAPIGTPGELVARGPFIFREYWGKPEATAEAFFPGGWFRTGDLAMQDKDGYFTILDRIKDIVVRGGENISCAEVEDVAYRYPGVSEASVLSLPHERLGEEVALVLALLPGSPAPSHGEVTSFFSDRLSRFKVPSRIFVWPGPELPHGATEKTPKREIKKLLLEGKPGVRELVGLSAKL